MNSSIERISFPPATVVTLAISSPFIRVTGSLLLFLIVVNTFLFSNLDTDGKISHRSSSSVASKGSTSSSCSLKGVSLFLIIWGISSSMEVISPGNTVTSDTKTADVDTGFRVEFLK